MTTTTKSKEHVVKIFFLKLIALVIIWGVAYHFILKPSRIPDKLLTGIITSGVTTVLNLSAAHDSAFTWIDYQSAAYIIQGGKTVFIIADKCNALDLIVIYLGFIILLPYPLKRKIIFGFGGIAAIIFVDVFRCLSLYWIYKTHPSMFYISHHYVFSILMYLFIFCGWVLFTRKGKVHAIN